MTPTDAGRSVLARLRRLPRPQAAALSLALVWLLAAAALFEGHRNLRQAYLQKSELFARVLADQASRALRAVEVSALAAVERAAVREDPGQRSRLLREIASGQGAIRSLSIVDDAGRILAHDAVDEIGPHSVLDRTVMQGLRDASRAGRWWTLDGRDALDARVPGGAPGSRWRVALRAWPLGDAAASTSTEWLVVALNLEHFSTQQVVLLDDERWQAAMLDVDGQILASTPNLELSNGRVDAGHAARTALAARTPDSREPAPVIGPGLDGTVAVIGHRPLTREPLTVVAETHRSRLLAEGFKSSLPVLGASLLATALLLVYSHSLARQNRARLRAESRTRRAARRAARSGAELRTLVDGLPEWMFRTDAAGSIRFVNRQWSGLSGYADSQALGQTLADLVHPDDAATARDLFQPDVPPAGSDDAPARRVRLCTAQGDWREIELTVAPLSPDGSAGYAGFAVDVTERERVRSQLVDQYRLTEQLLDAMPQPLFLTDARGELQLANRTWVEWLGLGHDAAPADEGEQELDRVHSVISMGVDEVIREGARSWPVDLPTAGGELRETVLSKVPLQRADGQIIGVIGTMVDVSEYRRAERVTEQARRAAEATSTARSEFVANVSHELRTPLQSILGFAELGKDRAYDPARAQALFVRIHGSGHRMLKLVEDLLDVSTLGSAVGRVSLKPTPPARVLDDMVQELRTLASSRKLKLDLALVPELRDRPAQLDAARFSQVLRNVVANAIRFAPEGSSIDLELVDSSGHAVVSVRDHGPGIPESELEAVFEPFVQSSRTRDGSGGTGLGLAICRNIMKAHRGFIVAENHEEGGAVFRIGLPWDGADSAAADDAAPAAASDAPAASAGSTPEDAQAGSPASLLA